MCINREKVLVVMFSLNLAKGNKYYSFETYQT